MIKIIWILTGLNVSAFLIFAGMFVFSLDGRNVDSMEKGWTIIFAALAIIVILLGCVPIIYSRSATSIYVTAFFAALPLIIVSWWWINKQVALHKHKDTMAEVYYKDDGQRAIAAAIEQNDTARVAQLIQGQNINIQGNKVWGWDGLNYLQFAIRFRQNNNTPVNEAANTAIIKLLIAHGADTKPALPDAIGCLPADIISLLIENGADPNTRGFVNPGPLLFETIGNSKAEIDMAILLVQKGADANAKNSDGLTPMIYAAHNADTPERWKDCWRFIRYLLEEAHANYTYSAPNGESLPIIVNRIQIATELQKQTMPPDFYVVAKWLKQHEAGSEL